MAEKENNEWFAEWFLNNEIEEPKLDLTQGLEEFEWISEFVPGINIAHYGGMAPFQAEGLINGLPYYYKARGNSIILKVNNKEARNAYGSNVLYRSSTDAFDSIDIRDTWLSVLLNLVEKLDKAPYLYEFSARSVLSDLRNPDKVEFTAGKRDNLLRVWGYSAEEAYQRTQEFHWSLDMKNWDEETKSRYIQALDVNSVPLNEDDRFYPDVPPVFSVNVPDEWRDDTGWINIPDAFAKR